MPTRVSLIFPYTGDSDQVRGSLIKIIERILDRNQGLHTSNRKPILVVNKDTIKKTNGPYENFVKFLAQKGKATVLQQLDVSPVWAVDTCQMWLHGLGKVIDDKADDSSDQTSAILQIPGDLTYVKDFDSFVGNLGNLSARAEVGGDIVIGDFEVVPQKSKHLIDLYGTYPLLYNWFPEFAREIRERKRINRPRSEFFALRADFLSAILPTKRKFAYEQTMAFLIHALSDNKKGREWRIEKVELGTIGDYDLGRGFREAIDQMERMERLLKLLWREANGGDAFKHDKFEVLDRRSSAIREAAIVSFKNFLRTEEES